MEDKNNKGSLNPIENEIRRALLDDFDIPFESKNNEAGKPSDDGSASYSSKDGNQNPDTGLQNPSTEDIFQDLTTREIWEEVRSEFETEHGIGSFKMPEGISKENEKKVLIEFFKQNIQPDLSEFPEEAKEIIELHKSGRYNPSEYFNKRNPENDITKLPDEDFLFKVYQIRYGKSEQNPDGVTDEEIHEELNNLTRIRKKEIAQAAKSQITEVRKTQEETENQKKIIAREEAFEKFQNQRTEAAEKIVNQFKDVSNFNGIELSSEQKKQFQKDFVEMVKLNKETGRHKLSEMLDDNATLYKVAAYIWLGEEGLKGYISDLKEGAKQKVVEKIDPTLEEERGGIKSPPLTDRNAFI